MLCKFSRNFAADTNHTGAPVSSNAELEPEVRGQRLVDFGDKSVASPTRQSSRRAPETWVPTLCSTSLGLHVWESKDEDSRALHH